MNIFQNHLELLINILTVLFFAICLWLYFKMAKELSGKIWWAIFLPYHILIFASIIKFKNSIQNIFIFYFAIVLIYGIFKGLTKIITSNFSVNLFEWFRPKRENTYDIDDSARTISNHKLIFIIGIIGVVMFFLLKQIKFE